MRINTNKYIIDCMNKREISMASFKGLLAIITINRIKEQYVIGKKQKNGY